MPTNLNDELVQQLINERRSDRRWKNGRFFGWMAILLIYSFFLFIPSPANLGSQPTKPYASLVRINGTILPASPNSADNIGISLYHAFADKRARGVVLLINSPGGSAVQSSLIHDKIQYLKKKYKKRVIVVAEDSLASGAYLVAAAADKIYVNGSTITGSIGVLMSGFGFSDVMKKIGISRRLFTAGKFKARMDPFEPLKPADTEKLGAILSGVHQQFINTVVKDRGKLLKKDQNIFSGDFWLGQQAVNLGLADGVATLWGALDKEFKVELFRDYTRHPSLLRKLLKDVREELPIHLTQPMRIDAMLH